MHFGKNVTGPFSSRVPSLVIQFSLLTNLMQTWSKLRKAKLPLFSFKLVLSSISSLNRFKIFAMQILISAMAKRWPMQVRFPPPNGLQVNGRIWSMFSFKNLSEKGQKKIALKNKPWLGFTKIYCHSFLF